MTAKQAPDAPLTPAETLPKAAGKMRMLTLDRLDGRTAAAKRARDLIGALENDLGGADRLTIGQAQIVQRAALLGAWIENSETTWIDGGPIEVSEYLHAVDVQRRLLTVLGLERRAKDVTPRLADILAGRA